MSTQDAHAARAERAFRPESARHEKGSAMGLIAEEAKATETKTARLKALRLEREASASSEPAPPVRKAAAKRAARR